MTTSSPLSGQLVTLFGGSGFIGNHVAQKLLERGARLRIASRQPEKAFSLKPLANLGQIQFVPCNLAHERSVAAALAGASHAVNLVGVFAGDLEKIMGEAPGTLARLARAQGLEALVHVSAIGPGASSDVAYARAKARGEEGVLAEFPQATILRPSIVFGSDDNFLNLFGGMIELLPVLPVFAPEAKLQLVYVDDVAEAVVTALEHPERHGGHTYELGGPEQIGMMELHERIAAAQGRSRRFIAMPDGLSALFAALPGTPMSTDQWKLLKPGNVVSEGARGFAELGIEPRAVGLFLDTWMLRYRKHGRFGLSNERAKQRRAAG
ncbi:MAG: 3-beta hydroxysteroid dehydrogenase [Erythrobacter sp. SCN 68-10]|nr:MAG: 3-beta hydroxysteroid dehydrogenase [Erythrobacter sp. SCN 68-10]